MTKPGQREPVVLNLVCCHNSIPVDIIRGPDVTCPKCKTRYAPNGFQRALWDQMVATLERGRELVNA